MSGLCSAHRHYEPGCPACEALGDPGITIEQLWEKLREIDDPRTEFERFVGRRLTIEEEMEVRSELTVLLKQVGAWPP